VERVADHVSKNDQFRRVESGCLTLALFRPLATTNMAILGATRRRAGIEPCMCRRSEEAGDTLSL